MGEPGARSTPVTLTPAEGAALARLATAAIGRRLAGRDPIPAPPDSAPLRVPGASFVTLDSAGALRGCIGSLAAVRPLYLDVVRNAISALADPRLPPVTVDEWPRLTISVSALGRPAPVDTPGRTELLALLRPGIDGLILTDGRRRATFLPAVWAKLPDPDQFLAALLAKGGWPSAGWPSGLRVARYVAEEFHDPPPRSPLA